MIDIGDRVCCVDASPDIFLLPNGTRSEPCNLVQRKIYEVLGILPAGEVWSNEQYDVRAKVDLLSVGVVDSFGIDLWEDYRFRKLQKLSPDPLALTALKSLTVKRREPVEAG